MNDLQTLEICDADYVAWCQRSIMADCFRALGLEHKAKVVMNLPANFELIDQYLDIICSEAQKRKNEDVLACLYRNGLLS